MCSFIRGFKMGIIISQLTVLELETGLWQNLFTPVFSLGFHCSLGLQVICLLFPVCQLSLSLTILHILICLFFSCLFWSLVGCWGNKFLGYYNLQPSKGILMVLSRSSYMTHDGNVTHYKTVGLVAYFYCAWWAIVSHYLFQI